MQEYSLEYSDINIESDHRKSGLNELITIQGWKFRTASNLGEAAQHGGSQRPGNSTLKLRTPW
jgi:hypothetical protein